MRAVAKQQDGCIGQVHPHDRLADRQSRQFGTHLGDDDRSGRITIGHSVGFGFLIDRRQDKGSGRLRILGLVAQPGVVIAQPALVAAQLLGQPLGCGVESRVIIRCRGATLDHDAAADMQ